MFRLDNPKIMEQLNVSISKPVDGSLFLADNG